MIQYPLDFKVSSKSVAGAASAWTSEVSSAQGKLTSTLAIPPEFEGPGGGYSPEDLYALALLNCFIATFKVIAEKSRLNFESIEGAGLLQVDRNESGVPWMKSFKMNFTLSGAPDLERAKRLLEKTSQSCMILNSVKTEKIFEFEVRP
jgi:organic hydroperoxide reductase OsmC/OhrA